MEEGYDPGRVDDSGPVELRRVLADARPERATAVHRPNRNGGRNFPEAPPGIELMITGDSPGGHPRRARRNVVCIDTGVHYVE